MEMMKNLTRKWPLRLCSLIGVLAAFAIVLLWFPRGVAAWTNPYQQIDAPAHYYFIRKILDEGVGAATHLWPNDGYYPPFFHLLAAGLIKLCSFFGVTVNVYTAVNAVWLVTSGLIWPLGMQRLGHYFIDRAGAPYAFRCAMMIIVPVLAVSSACHPFQMLASGPLIAFGLATSLLPFWLLATLRLFDAIAGIAARRKARRSVGGRTSADSELAASADAEPADSAVRSTTESASAAQPTHFWRWFALTALSGLLCLFAHPRIAFTWLLLMGAFALLRLPWKVIAGLVIAVAAAAVAFFFYMTSTYKSSRYFDPSSWFHTYTPNRTVPEALRIFFTDNIAGFAGVCMTVVVVLALIVAVVAIIRPRMFKPAEPSAYSSSRALRKDAAALILAFLLVLLVYVCSTSLTGWFPNIVAAAWYRTETRPLTMIPLAIVPLLTFAGAIAANLHHKQTELQRMTAAACVVAIVLGSLAVVCQINNTTRGELSQYISDNMQLDDDQPTEQLTATKAEILEDVVEETGTDAAIISDPLNGSMYGMTMYGANMLYPIYNPQAEKNGAIFGEVERAFASGDDDELLNVVCPIETDEPEYFLTMGPQAESLQMFTFKEQYDMFHDEALIAQYVKDGALVKVQDYSSLASYAKGWALYRFGCSTNASR